MISRKEVLIRMGKIRDPEDVINDIQKYILEAADKGETSIKYVLGNDFYQFGCLDDREAIISELERYDYVVCKDKEAYSNTIHLTIYW